jgi:hypothetical protein
LSGEQRLEIIPLAVDMLADELEQRMCAITVNADAVARMLDSPSPDLAEIRAALADIAREAQGACDSMRAARPDGWYRPTARRVGR